MLALLALLLAPAGMLGSHAAMAMPPEAAMSAMSHCDDRQAPTDHDRKAMLDCAIACTAMPAAEPMLASEPALPAPLPALTRVRLVDGIPAEAATPPPRFS